MSDVNKKPLTMHGKLYKLEIKNEAIVCPCCGQKIRGVRLLTGTVVRELSVMCQRCHTISIVNIDQACATYYSPRHRPPRGRSTRGGGSTVDKISPTRLDALRRLIDQGNEARFYWWPQWQEMREAVLKMDHYECQICKARGRYSRGSIVHHVKHLRERPDLALSVYDPDTGERQLVTVCKACHEEEHPESLRRCVTTSEPITMERWD